LSKENTITILTGQEYSMVKITESKLQHNDNIGKKKRFLKLPSLITN